jgi:hypothetical protein
MMVVAYDVAAGDVMALSKKFWEQLHNEKPTAYNKIIRPFLT